MLAHASIRLILTAVPAPQLNFQRSVLNHTPLGFYMYTAVCQPTDNELKILEFNKSIMKLQEIFHEKRLIFFRTIPYSQYFTFLWKWWFEYEIHHTVTFWKFWLEKSRIWTDNPKLAIILRFFGKNWSKEKSVCLRIFITSVLISLQGLKVLYKHQLNHTCLLIYFKWAN